MDPALIPALYDALIVARTGSVGAAARRLNKTPSAVSQQIRHLTETLGVPLFERRGRGLVLTRAAEQVLPAATRLFDEAHVVFRLFAELSGATSTTLRLATSDYLAKPLLVPVLRDLAAQGAPLHFEISTVHSEEALGRLERGDVEMAIVSFAGDRRGLSVRPLFEQPFFWVMSKRGGKQVRLRTRLSEEPLLRLAPGSLGRKLLDRYLEEHRIRASSTIDVPSVSLLLAYAEGGVGVGLAPALPLERSARARFQLERADVPALPVQLVMRSGWRVDPTVERFIERVLAEAARARAHVESLVAAP
jgi:DNA-binding transcriptional LysR family regulator